MEIYIYAMDQVAYWAWVHPNTFALIELTPLRSEMHAHAAAQTNAHDGLIVGRLVSEPGQPGIAV